MSARRPLPATTITLHGVFIEIFGLGVLLSGDSGVGKSELALELLTRGHRLIADDAAEFVLNAQGRVEGRCPPLIRGFLEVRALGVLNVERMYGASAVLDQQPLDLILHLQRAKGSDALPDRVFGQRDAIDVLGLPVPRIVLPVRLGHNLAAMAEAACRDRQLKLNGYDAAQDFAARQQAEIDRQTKESATCG